MERSIPANYTEKVIFALTNAITDASIDEATKTVTYRTGEAIDACIGVVAILAHAKAETGPRMSLDELEEHIVASLRRFVSALSTVAETEVLDADRPGFATRTLA